MKKILVLSDTHGRFDKVLKIFEKENPDIVISAGDGIKDIEELSYIYDDKIYYKVKGNCDFFERNCNEEEIFEIDNIKFYLTHGHLYRVKRNLEELKERVKKLNVDITIYGHTHKENLELGDNIIFNPGAAEDGKYGLILINKNKEIQVYNRKL